MAPDHTISAATRVHSWENPWLPICVATLYFTAASRSRRASHGVLVSGFSTYTDFPRSIAASATVACMKSGTATMQASMFLPSLSSMTRKSLYFGALSKRLNTGAARSSSTSHRATMFSVRAASPESAAPWLPQPTTAMWSLS